MDIRHVPAGRGHHYQPSLDQRHPVHPASGEMIELRALTPQNCRELMVDLLVGEEWRSIPARPLVDAAAADVGGGDGHLASAATAGESVADKAAWVALVGPFDAQTPVRYRFRSADARSFTSWHDFVVGEWRPAPEAVTVDGSGAHRFADVPEQFVTGGRVVRVRLSLPLRTDEHVVGLGERFHALDQRGWSIDATVFEQYRDQGVRTYLPVPFGHVVGGDGWGFHIDTTDRVWFDVGATDPSRIHIVANVDPEYPTLSVHIWDGTPDAVLRDFFQIVGQPQAVPDWAYRPWISSNEWNTQRRVEDEVDRSITAGIDVGVVVIEAWSDEATMYIWRDAQYSPRADGSSFEKEDFSYPADGAWPDPEGMISRLADKGVRVVLWQIPLVPDRDVDVPQLVNDRIVLASRGYAVAEENGDPYRNRGWWFPGALLPDFTRPAVRSWWTDKRRYLIEMGVAGFKTDGGEHAWGEELRYGDGTRGSRTNNRFPNLYAQAYHELFEATGAHGLTFSRAGHAGAGSYPAHWAGDERSTWEAYRASLTAGLTAAASGVFAWSWDHAGFSGPLPSAELYLRTAASAVFSPIMQYHAEYNEHRTPSRDRTPWNLAEQADAPEVVEIYSFFTRLRGRLVPYLSEQMSKSVRTAVPLMRPLFFDYPEDNQIWDHPLQYLLGDALLIAPVTDEGAAEWTTYLPDGHWVDVWTADSVTGPAEVSRPVPLDTIPVFCRADRWSALRDVFRERP